MQRVLRLTAWHWHLARRWQWLILAFLTVGQGALLVYRAWYNVASGDDLNYPLNTINHSGCIPLFVLAYLAAALAAQRPLLLARGRSKAANPAHL